MRPMIRISEAVSKAMSEHDPAAGDLFSDGRIAYTTRTSAESIVTFAIPGGEHGEALRLVSSTPTMKNNRRTSLVDRKGAPIQQICFASPIETSNPNNLLPSVCLAV